MINSKTKWVFVAQFWMVEYARVTQYEWLWQGKVTEAKMCDI